MDILGARVGAGSQGAPDTGRRNAVGEQRSARTREEGRHLTVGGILGEPAGAWAPADVDETSGGSALAQGPGCLGGEGKKREVCAQPSKSCES